MAIVAALFGSQAEATKALDAMVKTEFEDAETTVYEGAEITGDRGDGAPEVELATAPSVRSGVIAGDIGDVVNKPIGELKDPAVSDYFVREVKKRNAALVVADVDADHADDLEAFFRQQGGQTTEET